MAAGGEYICFYSNRCDWSRAFINELKQTPLVKQFKFMCVDPDASGRRPALPSWLKKTPTLYIKGDQAPIKTDGEVMNWLRLTMMANSKSNPTDELDVYMGTDQFHSMYSAVGKDDIIDAEQTAMFNNNYYEPIAGPGVRTASEMPGQHQHQQQQGGKSQKADLFDKQMQDYMSARNVGVPMAKPRL